MSSDQTRQLRPTVIVPTLNAASSLPALLQMILEQKPLPPVEVIVLDRGSTDATRDVGRSFKGVWLRNASDVSLGHTRNVGVRFAQSNIAVFVDQAALPANASWLENLVAPFADPNVAVTFPLQLAPSDAPPPAHSAEPIMYSAQQHGDAGGRTRDVFMPEACMAVRRSAFFRHPFDESLVLGEDRQFAHDAVMAGCAVVYVPGSVVIHSTARSFGQTLGLHFDRAYAASKSHPPCPTPSGDPEPGIRFLPLETTPKQHLAGIAGKSVGTFLGPLADRLPKPVVRRLSSQPRRWRDQDTVASAEGAAAAYPYRNLYHCCTIKSASQWFRSLIRTHLVRRCTGMAPCHWSSDMGVRAPLDEQAFKEPFPDKTIAESLYVRFGVFESIPKPGSWKAFYVLRDPRDILVSWYYSLKYSHEILDDHMLEQRKILESSSKEDGLIYGIGRLTLVNALVDAQRSWVAAEEEDERIKVFRFEDLFGPNEIEAFESLLAFLEIPVSRQELTELLSRLSFNKFSGGRKKGDSDPHHHYRSGTAGGWKQEFTPRVTEAFSERTGDLLQVLGYEPGTRAKEEDEC